MAHEHVSDRVARRLRKDFGSRSERIARQIGEVTDSEREQAAVLLLADGDEYQLAAALHLARTDRRDLLVAADLADDRWPSRLDHELGRTSRAPRRRLHGWLPRRGRLRTALLILLVAPGVLFFFVGVPLLIIDDYREAAGRVEETTGVVLEHRSGWSKGGRRHVCTYDYVVDGLTRTGTAECGEDDGAGDEVTVRYDPTDPASSDLSAGNDLVGLIVGLGAGAVCILVPIVYFVRDRRRRT
ncbi:DUF3592 domain-containing protein [Janibacter anophelis]|uniref:DUF3592 domain-containing protein n=1 Tax=Janibacter anophelis TaxID=319054 RepID=UPI000829D042|nr:DUF3592 domain-containing protein [Janibacter anophelis]